MCDKPIVYLGDCLGIMKKLPDNCYDWVFTSPPYNRKRKDKYTFYVDDIKDYFDFLVKRTDEMFRVAKKGVFVNIQTTYYNRQEIYRYIGHYSNLIQEIFIQEKTNPMPASGNSITNAVEYVILLANERIKANHTYTKNIFKTSVARMPKEHKAVMHTDVVKFFANNFFKEGDTILDPFAGMGTTMKVCQEMGFKSEGIEICPEYAKLSGCEIKEIN